MIFKLKGSTIKVGKKTETGSQNGKTEISTETTEKRPILPCTPAQTASYISDLTQELCLIAERADMPFLAYLLNLSGKEAESQTQRKS